MKTIETFTQKVARNLAEGVRFVDFQSKKIKILKAEVRELEKELEKSYADYNDYRRKVQELKKTDKSAQAVIEACNELQKAYEIKCTEYDRMKEDRESLESENKAFEAKVQELEDVLTYVRDNHLCGKYVNDACKKLLNK